jgi:hypothetical protein
MTHPSRPRKTATLSDSVHRQLNLYALAAGAAGVSLIASASPAEAKIVYTPIHKIIGPNHTYGFDLDNDGRADFAIKNLRNCDTDNTCTSFVSAIRYAANAVEGTAGTQFSPPGAYALKAGARISGKRPFLGVRMAGAGQTTNGNWYNVRNRYLGLSFQIKGRTHYGWARLTVKLRRGFVVTLTGFAYETIPGKGIIAGQTKDLDESDKGGQELNPAALEVPTPEAASLGALAMGAPGLSIWRREEHVSEGKA